MLITLRSTHRTLAVLASATLGLGLATGAAAQTGRAKPAAKPVQAPSQPAPSATLTAVPTKPSDPIAMVNGEPITRGQLADECVSQHGREVLEALIARRLIQQAVVSKKLTVTPADVDAEINRTAEISGVSREQFLTMLAKERNISPRQYADYIAYPMVALRKLAEPRVQVTETDIDEAFQAYFGEKLRCRVIMVDTQQKATEVWNLVKANPGGFPQIAKERSMDSATAALGGMLPDPIVRFGAPRNVSEVAFEQLVDGDPDDNDPAHKPKDGSFSGPIQVTESAWILLRREALEPGQPHDKTDKAKREELKASIRQAKIESESQLVMEQLLQEAAIENGLTGQNKLAQREVDQVKPDANVKRMSDPAGQIPAAPTGIVTPR